MSRHRNVRKLNIQDELEEDDDRDFCGRSLEEDETPLSAEASQFVYNRRGGPPAQSRKEDENWQEGESADTGGDGAGDEIFHIDVPPGYENFVKDGNKGKQSGKGGKGKVAAAPQRSKSALPSRQEHLKATPISASQTSACLPAGLPRLTMTPLEVALATASPKVRRRDGTQAEILNLVIVGHVDAGKSTLVGHLLHLVGDVDDRALHRYRQDASRSGKASFAFAFILDEGEEERSRGITMDVARAAFISPFSRRRKYNVLDAPGHRDFVSNMISGAAQADAALLVINSTTGEFETGFREGGQTREHALLLRSLGVTRVIVAVNKLDTVGWNQERYSEVAEHSLQFLRKQVGFDDVVFVPASGLLGTNLVERPEKDHPLAAWYTGPTLIQALDAIPCVAGSKGLDEAPLRLAVHDVVRMTPGQLHVTGKILAGSVETGDTLFVMPDAIPITVSRVTSLEDTSNLSASPSRTPNRNRQSSQGAYFVGEQVDLFCSGAFEPVNSIHLICSGGRGLVAPITKFLAKIVVFDVKTPILSGSRVELFIHSLRFSCAITKIVALVRQGKTGAKEVIKCNPRLLVKGNSAEVEIECDSQICVEPYEKCKAMSRFTLRSNDDTIAAGVVEKIIVDPIVVASPHNQS